MCSYVSKKFSQPLRVRSIWSGNKIIASNENALNAAFQLIVNTIIAQRPVCCVSRISIMNKVTTYIKTCKVSFYLPSPRHKCIKMSCVSFEPKKKQQNDEKLPIKLKQLGLIVPINIVFPMHRSRIALIAWLLSYTVRSCNV